MFENEYFYNKSLRKLIVAFGSLFSNVVVEHPTKDNVNTQIKVPITYAPQEKFIRRLLEPSSISDNTRIENQLPRLSYIMSGVNVDASRRFNKLNAFQSASVVGANDCSNTGSQVTERVPVNVGFSLFIYTRNFDDTLQIVEQIVPYFNPDHVISIDMNDAQTNVLIPITMTQNNITEKYDGDFGGRRINISSLSFVAKSFIYGKVSTFTRIDTSTVSVGLTGA